MGAFVQDLSYGVRQIRRSPWVAALAAGSLAIGIGATTTVFTIFDAALMRPLPVSEPQRLVEIKIVDNRTGRLRGIPPSILRGLQNGSKVFDGILATIPDGVSFRFGDSTERVVGDAVTANYFTVLGVRPFLGRFFHQDGDGAKWQAEVVLSYDFFDRRFGRDPAIVGKVVHLNGYPFTVVGVSPKGFFGVEAGYSWQVRFPMMIERGMPASLPALGLLDPRNENSIPALARVKSGISREQAEAATDVLFQQLIAADPEVRVKGIPRSPVRLEDGSRGNSGLAGQYGRTLLLVMALAAVLLLVACANVANLLLTRAAGRQVELAIRAAIGASRRRIVHQLLTESFVLAIIGGAFGFLLAYRGSGLLTRLLPQGSIPLTLNIDPDLRVLAFTMMVSLFTTILSGLAPALRTSRLDLIETMKAHSGSFSSKPALPFAGSSVMPIQIALALVLSAGATLFASSLIRLRTDLGYLPEKVLMLSVKPVRDGDVYYTEPRLRSLYLEMVRRTEELPRVTAASMAAGGLGTLNRRAPAVPIEKDDGTTVMVDLRADEVSPGSGFLSTMGLVLIRGRAFTNLDHAGPPVVIISDTLERELFGQDAIGRKITFGAHRVVQSSEIVGIVRHSSDGTSGNALGRFVYMPLGQRGFPSICTLLVRADAGRASSLVAAIRGLIQSIDKDVPVFNIRTASMEVDRVLARERMLAVLASWFGGVALLLVAVGLYGSISYSVARRVREIGIRMALGASRTNVVWLVVGDTLRLALAGIAIGLPMAFSASRFVSSELEGVLPGSPWILVGCSTAVLAVAVVASLVPAKRAATLIPLAALRQE